MKLNNKYSKNTKFREFKTFAVANNWLLCEYKWNQMQTCDASLTIYKNTKHN